MLTPIIVIVVSIFLMIWINSQNSIKDINKKMDTIIKILSKKEKEKDNDNGTPQAR